MKNRDSNFRTPTFGRVHLIFWTLAFGGLTACAPDTPAPHPECIWEDGCPSADVQSDTQIGDADDATTTVERTITFAVDTQKGLVLNDNVTLATIYQATADKDPAVAGVQVDVSITTANVPDGAALEVLLNGIKVGPPAQVLNNAGRVNGITLPCTPANAPLSISVRAIVDAAKSDAAVSKDKSLIVSCASACVASVNPLSQSCLTKDQDPLTPGFQQTFIVHSDQSDCTDAYLLVIGPPGTPTETVHVLLNGSTSVPVMATLAVDDTGLIGVTATVIGVVEDTANPDRGSTPSQPVSTTITTEAPSILITQPTSGQIKLTDDLDPLTPGIQVSLTGTASSLSAADKNAIELYVDGTLTTKVTQSPTGEFTIPLSFTTSGTHALLVKATNSCGLSGQKSKSLAVFVDKAGIEILSPVPDTVLRVSDDLDKSTPDVLETSLAIAVTLETAGTNLEVYCKPTLAKTYPNTPTAVVLYTDPTVLTLDIPLKLAINELGQEIECRVQDNSPNQTVSTSVTFFAALPPPCLHVIGPANAVTVTTGSVEFLLETSGLDGQSVLGYLITPSGVPLDAVDLGAPVTNHLAGSFPLQDGGVQVPDGTYTLTFQATDKWGNLAGQSLCSDVTRTVTIDTTPPTLVITAPVKATLTTLDDPDSDPAKPGYQIDVEVTITDAHSVCLTVDGVLFSCNTNIPEGTGVIVFHDVSLQPGATVLTVFGSDVNGNSAAPPATVVNLISDVPVVKFVSPVGSEKVATDSVAFTVNVTSPGDGTAVIDATLEVLQNGVSVPVAVTETAPGVYAFELSGFSAGSTTVQVGAYVAAVPDKKGYSSELTITFKSSLPTATIQSPIDGQVLNVANLTCALGLTDCVLPVSATFTDVEDGSPAELTVTCGASVTKSTTTVQGGAIKLLNVKLLDQNVCDLSVAVTDAAGQVGVSPVVHVTVDRVAPSFGLLKAPPESAGGLTLLSGSDLDHPDATNGMQIDWQMWIAGVPAGATVTCDVTDDLGKPAPSFSGNVAATTPDGTMEPVDFGVASLPNGYNIKIVCRVQDAAGNQAQKTLLAQILANVPQVYFISEFPNADPCVTAADCVYGGICYQNLCTVPWNKLENHVLSVKSDGLPDGTQLRICSDAPGLTGTACAKGGYVVVAETVFQQSTATADLNGLADGQYHVIAEAFNPSKNVWINSLDSGYKLTQHRKLLIDTVPPVVAMVTGPSTPGTPATCLSEADQLVKDGQLPGGKFQFQIAMANEDATVSLRVNQVTSGPVATIGKVGTLAVNIAVEGTATFETIAVDLVGNLSDQMMPSLLVDTQRPLADFATPSNKPSILFGDNRDIELVSVSDDVEGELAQIMDFDVSKASQAFIAGHAFFPDAVFGILTDGSHALTASVQDHCGNSNVIATSPVVVAVDTQPPMVDVTAPSEGALFTDNDDAAPDQLGYQVALTFSTTGATTWALELGTDCDAGSLNCAGFTAVGNGTIANPGGLEAPVLVTVPFDNTIHYQFRLTASDAAGNKTSVSRGFDVLLSGCLAKLDGLPSNYLLNTQNCATPGQNCGSVTLLVTASYVGPCGSPTGIKLLKGGVEVGTIPPVGQAAAFDVTIVDGESTDLTIVVLEGLNVKKQTAPLPISADLTNPTISFAAATILGSPTVSGTSALQGKEQDLSGTTPDHQVHFALSLADAHLNGGKLTALDRAAAGGTVALSNTTVTAPVSLTGIAQTLDVEYASLLADQLNSVTATVQDAFGNKASATIAVTVDWIAPAAITLDALSDANLNPRRPSAKFTFQAVGDNGLSGKAASYLVRYSKKAIATQADFDAACDPAKIAGFTATIPADAGTAESVTISGPDGRNPTDLCKFVPFTDNGLSSYYFAIEAVDAAGNKGALSNVPSTDKLRLKYRRIVNSGGAGSTFDQQNYRGRVFGLGDLNGDGYSDVGVGGGATTPFCVVYGRAGTADIDLATEPAATLQCFANPGGLAGQVASPADVNGDGVSDLIIGAKTGSGVPREMWVFLGNKGAQLSPTPAVIITGIVATSANAQGPQRMQTVGNFNGDVSASGKPVMDIAVRSAKDLNYTNSETVYVIPGSPGWSNAAPLTITLTSAQDRSNNNIVRVRLSDGTSNSTLFGQYFRGGNVLLENGGTGQQFDELVLSQQAAPQQMYVLRGRQLSGPLDIMMTSVDTGLQAGDAESVRLRPTTTGAQGFAVEFDLVEFDGQPGLDLVEQHVTGQVADHPGFYWTRGSAISAAYGAAPPKNVIALAVTGAVAAIADLYTTEAGYVAYVFNWGPQSVGNFFDNPALGGHMDVMYARPPFTGATSGGQIVVLRMAVPRTETNGEVGYVFEDLVISDPFVPTSAAFGYNNAAPLAMGYAPAGDFNQDGFVDLIIGSSDGAGGVIGSTMIVY